MAFQKMNPRPGSSDAFERRIPRRRRKSGTGPGAPGDCERNQNGELLRWIVFLRSKTPPKWIRLGFPFGFPLRNPPKRGTLKQVDRPGWAANQSQVNARYQWRPQRTTAERGSLSQMRERSPRDNPDSRPDDGHPSWIPYFRLANCNCPRTLCEQH